MKKWNQKRPRKAPCHWGINQPYKLILIECQTWEEYERLKNYFERDGTIFVRYDVNRPIPLMCRWPIDEIIISEDIIPKGIRDKDMRDLIIHDRKRYLDLYKNPLTHKPPCPHARFDKRYYE